MAQEVEVIYLERNQALVQVNSTDLFPAGLLLEDWSNYSFGAGMDVLSGSLSNLYLSGPGSSGSWPILNEWEGEYSLYREFQDVESMETMFPPGVYTFSGTGSGTGAFSQELDLPAYDPISPKRVTNFDALQSFDPNADPVISWEPFTEGMAGLGGFIEVYVSFWNGYSQQWIWDSSGLYLEGDFGLSPDTTSVTVPADVFQSTNATDYQVDLFFIRIDSMDTPEAFPDAILANITTLDVLFTMIPALTGPHPLLVPGTWQMVERLGPVFGYSSYWGYSPNMGFLYVGWGPDWVYQTHIGWMSPQFLAPGKGKWLYSLAEGWLWIPIPPGDGWYVREDGSTGNMKRP